MSVSGREILLMLKISMMCFLMERVTTILMDRYTGGLIFTMQMKEMLETLSATKTPKKDGKGNLYVDKLNHHMPIFEAVQTMSGKAFKTKNIYKENFNK